MVRAGGANKSALWMSRKKPELPTVSKRKQLDSEQPVTLTPLQKFLQRQINYFTYKDSEKVLGTTHGMLILEDFEATTPNVLARCLETVQGGGIVVFLFNNIKSVEELGHLDMDVHEHFKTEASHTVLNNFNQRFAKTLQTCPNCIVLGEQLQILQKSESDADVVMDEAPKPLLQEIEGGSESPLGEIANLAKTLDQQKTVLAFQKLLGSPKKHTLTLTAGRGRGKSAALGLSVASALAKGLTQIYVSAPSPENLKTFFQFTKQGLKKLGYKERSEYDVVVSTKPAYNKAVVQLNVTKSHKQCVQYLDPNDSHLLSNADMIVIDEAAAIPLPLVKKLMKPNFVVMASTVNGYEGTGRSLSLKLIQQLREQQNVKKHDKRRLLTELTLEEPIRYSSGDSVEAWLNNLLCLEATEGPLPNPIPNPSDCHMFYVPKNALFSYTMNAESLLHKIMALFVSSHYKNSPNDLQLLADAPSQHLYILMDPSSEEPLCAIQLAIEGGLSSKDVQSTLNKGERGNGDLIPWLLAQQVQKPSFAELHGARVVRIAVKEGCTGKGYGQKALSLLQDYFLQIYNEKVAPKAFSDIITPLGERVPEKIHYLGVSYGLTTQLHRFWKRNGYAPAYIRQIPNELTGEYSCVMIKSTDPEVTADIENLILEFYKRFVVLLSYEFHSLSVVQALSIVEAASRNCSFSNIPDVSWQTVISSTDVNLMVAYSNNLLDYSNIRHLLPKLGELWFNGKFLNTIKLSAVESGFLMGVGLQRKSIETVARELDLSSNMGQKLLERCVRSIATGLKSAS